MRLPEALSRLRYNAVPDHLIGEVLTKRWTDNLVPFLFLVALLATFGGAINGFFSAGSLLDTVRQLGEFLILVIGLTVVMLGGGIDLSAGSIYALSVFAAVMTIYVAEAPAWVALLASLAVGTAFGAVNGFLVGYLRLRAFLTTLVTLIIGRSVFAHIGGFPLGLAMDRDGSIKTCVGAMGLYSIAPDRTVTQLSTETRRSLLSVVDDARLRDPNDCDIGPDGRIWFTDSTTRYDAHDWALDSIESRPTGRLLVYDPRTGRTRTVVKGLRYANGVCLAHDGRSILIAESWACSIHRYWLEGPKEGRLECVIRDMPGYPDNINRASYGTYWMAWLGLRTPSFDLSLRPSRLPQDDDAPAAAGRLAVPEHQYRRRGEVRRERAARAARKRPRSSPAS